METNRIEYKQKLTEHLEKEVVAFLNYLGRSVYKQENINFEKGINKLELKTSNWSKGAYFIRITGEVKLPIMEVLKQ